MFKLFAELIGLHLDAPRAPGGERGGAARASARARSCASSSSPCSATTCAIRSPRSTAGRRLLSKQPLDDKAQHRRQPDPEQRRPHGRTDRQRAGLRARAPGRRPDGEPQTRRAAGAGARTGGRRAARAWPDRTIETEFALTQPVAATARASRSCSRTCWPMPLTHGGADSPSTVRASADRATFELSVSNQGDPIPRGHDRAPVPAVLPRRVRPGPARARPRPLHRLGDRPRPWRRAERRLHARRNPLHIPHAVALTCGMRQPRRRPVRQLIRALDRGS